MWGLRVFGMTLLFITKCCCWFLGVFIDCHLRIWTIVLILHNTARVLGSSVHLLLHVTRSGLKTKRDRVFPVAGLKLWNSISVHVKSTLDYGL